MDLREHADLIKAKVAEKNGKDPNWKWSVKSIGKTVAHIRWGYLDYLEEKKNSFILKAEGSDSLECLYAMTPHEEVIEAYIVSEVKKIGADTFPKDAVALAIDEIAYYAHSRY